MLWQRFLTALLGIPFALLVVYWGKLPFFLTITILSLLGLKEYFGMVYRLGAKPFCLLGYFAALIILGATYLGTPYTRLELLLPFFLFGAISLLSNFGKRNVKDFALTFLGVFYVAGFFSYLLQVRFQFSDGFQWVVMILILIWVNDSGAYFVGKKFGKRKLHHLVSPKKTVEGAVGGIVATALTAMLLNYFWQLLPALHGIILSVLVAITGIVGDLWESALKREAGIKDSGILLPGHGGILDRFDSLLFAIPVVYYYLQGFIID
ncbi:phosphatidate cytidylyltransferase [Zhaonella formicivorans]|uniref:phosphatidate cytidylyltransferase n=1 Tax=Zhaonella formicivorans TaxID=2528593 RepID=UPI0010DE2B91|nr:phosphatidate cytidylyltransferase [Zhaonella formicivorans]